MRRRRRKRKVEKKKKKTAVELYTAVTTHAAWPHRPTSDSPLRAPWPSSEGRGTCFSIFPLVPLVRPDAGSLRKRRRRTQLRHCYSYYQGREGRCIARRVKRTDSTADARSLTRHTLRRDLRESDSRRISVQARPTFSGSHHCKARLYCFLVSGTTPAEPCTRRLVANEAALLD